MDPNAQYQNPLEAAQPTAPMAAPPPNGVPTQAKLKKTRSSLILVSVISVILFLLCGFLTFRAFVGTAQLDASFDKGVEKGKADQTTHDAAVIKDIKENPYYTYTAPSAFGSFILSYPRNWSYTVSINGSDYVAFVNPSFVDIPSGTYALEVTMRNGKYADQKKNYDAQVKSSKGKLVSSSTHVSDIEATQYSGQLSQARADATLVILQVRDKVMYLQTDNTTKYGQYFNDILKRIKINP